MTGRVPTIYVDLDDTLIHSVHGLGRNPGKRTPILIGAEDRYHSFLRPSAIEMLTFFRKRGRTRMLTTATRDYAIAHNDTFQLGFEKEDIVAREDYVTKVRLAYGSEWVPVDRKTDPNALLVDNLPARAENSRIKTAYLGIKEENYIQIRDFDGKDPDCFRGELLEILAKVEALTAGGNAPRLERGKCRQTGKGFSKTIG